MRAREFIFERNYTKVKVPLDKDQHEAIPGAHRVAGTADRTYDLNRVMMCVAAADGKTPPDVHPESWAGRNNIAIPYTAVEADMLKHAYKAMGAQWDDALSPNPKNQSLETKSVNTTSPVKGFTGFPKRK